MKKDLQTLHSEFMDEYEFVAKRSPITLKAYKQAFDVLIKLMPTITLETISAETINEFFKKLQTRKRLVGKKTIHTGVQASTIETYRSKLGTFFSWLKRKNLITVNPFEQIKAPNVKYDNIKYLRKNELEKLFAGINFNITWTNNLIKKRNDIIIALGLCCGLRRNEILNLSMNDIDMERKILTVQGKTSKSAYTRQIPINSFLYNRLADYIQERKKSNYKTHYLIISGTNDGRLSIHGMKHTMDRLIKETGVNFHLHQLRHTFAINYLLSGSDIIKLKQLMGHTDIRMTEKYARSLPTSALRSSVEAITLENLF
jgi:integrase/recombinase XerD